LFHSEMDFLSEKKGGKIDKRAVKRENLAD